MGKRSMLVVVVAVALAAAGLGVWVLNKDDEPVAPALAFGDIVPVPAEAVVAEGVAFTIPAGATIITSPDSAEAAAVGAYLAELVGGTQPRVGSDREAGSIGLLIDPAITAAEAYELVVDGDGVTIRAGTAAGLFWGVQTLRQLIPTSGPMVVPGGRITDQPRFAYRGVMLDVARHFFDVAAVQRLIDLAAMYKVNHLHLHLTDDQGWRIAVESWPRLTTYGAELAVGGGAGGYYTQDDYRQIVAYAQSRFMTVVPEVDLPGHTNAALASYAELNCNGVAPERYTGVAVGFSALCPDRNVTYRFLEDVFGELAALTPGPYLHIGGDEVQTLDQADYATIVTRAQAIVGAYGKAAVGWHDVASAALPASTVLQFWGTTPDAPEVVAAAEAGNRVIMSPANRAYLDQKYDATTPIGLTWAGPTSVEEAYDWDPASYLPGVGESAVLGVEAPLWTETVTTVDDIEYLVFPRLAAIAEIGWSQLRTHDWPSFRQRLGAQAPRWSALDVDFARVDGVAWAAE